MIAQNSCDQDSKSNSEFMSNSPNINIKLPSMIHSKQKDPAEIPIRNMEEMGEFENFTTESEKLLTEDSLV